MQVHHKKNKNNMINIICVILISYYILILYFNLGSFLIFDCCVLMVNEGIQEIF